MDDRTLAYYNGGVSAKERGENPGRYETIRVDRPLTSSKGLHFTVSKFDGSFDWDSTSIYVPDAATFLAPVVEWLNGGTE